MYSLTDAVNKLFAFKLNENNMIELIAIAERLLALVCYILSGAIT
jgi:hypothetical protein